MTAQQEAAIRLIEKQQAEAEAGGAVWMAGEQLKDICRAEPDSAALLAKDLEQKGMDLKAAEKAIKGIADENHQKLKGNSACVSPAEAEAALRKLYGLPERAAAPAESAPAGGELGLRFEDFL